MRAHASVFFIDALTYNEYMRNYSYGVAKAGHAVVCARISKAISPTQIGLYPYFQCVIWWLLRGCRMAVMTA
jgi:hypothetical protein